MRAISAKQFARCWEIWFQAQSRMCCIQRCKIPLGYHDLDVNVGHPARYRRGHAQIQHARTCPTPRLLFWHTSHRYHSPILWAIIVTKILGLYYFILLAITGLSTVTTSMFVFLERDVRIYHEIPWYLRWLAFDLTSRITRTISYHRASKREEITVSFYLVS